MRKQKTWALVSNAVRARILRGLENGETEDLVELASKAASTHLRDIYSDKPGRSMSSDQSGRRSAMEHGADPVRRDMQDFARETWDFLEQHHRAGDFGALAILAEPRMLGILREEMPATLRDAIKLERPVNLVQLTEEKLRETVRDIVHPPL